MSKLTELLKSEPVMARGLLAVLVTYGLSTLTSFGVVLTEAQQNAITGLIAVIFLVVLFLIRAKVTPADLVAAKETSSGVVVAGPAAEQPTGSEVVIVTEAPEPVAAPGVEPTPQPEEPTTRLGDIEDEEPVDDDEDTPATDNTTEGR